MQATMQSIFQAHFAQYAHGRTLCVRELRAAWAISSCRTAALGGHVLRCEQGHTEQIRYHSCRHRSCTRCSAQPRQQWAEAHTRKLLACEHRHIIFTLPHELNGLWAYNRSRLAALLFDSVRETLLQLCADERWLGVTPGIVLALHTWGRTLSRHPHVHCLVSEGGLNASGQWQASTASFLLPVRVLKSLYRGKLLARLSHAVRCGRLVLPPSLPAPRWRALLRALYRKNFNLDVGERYAHGMGVVRYLARYVKGGALSARRLTLRRDRSSKPQVAFAYTDHRDGRAKRLRLAPAQFIERVLWHAPPRGQHTVRHAGLYASGARAQRERCARLIAATVPPHTAWPLLPAAPSATTLVPSCPTCTQPLRRIASLLPAHRFGEFSNTRRRSPPRQAQRGVEADAPLPLMPRVHSTQPPQHFLSPSGALLN